MISRLYIHNFRCLENFDLRLADQSSVLLLGRNGAGKTTVGLALEVLQKIGRGTNRVAELLGPQDLNRGKTGAPLRLEVEAVLQNRSYKYALALEFPSKFRELRVFQESLIVDGAVIFTRELAQVKLARTISGSEAAFRIDWHLIALPIVQEQGEDDPLAIFKSWLAGILILKPVPSLANGLSEQNKPSSQVPDRTVTNMGAWFANLVSTTPASYTHIQNYLRDVMPDFDEIKNANVGKDARVMEVHFKEETRSVALSLEELSDGEKCFVVFALTIAAAAANEQTVCFWDEPDNFLAPNEVAHSIMALRRAFNNGPQIIIASHNPEAIQKFSDENTLYLSRNSHMEPAILASVQEMRADNRLVGNLTDALLRGDFGA